MVWWMLNVALAADVIVDCDGLADLESGDHAYIVGALPCRLDVDAASGTVTLEGVQLLDSDPPALLGDGSVEPTVAISGGVLVVRELDLHASVAGGVQVGGGVFDGRSVGLIGATSSEVSLVDVGDSGAFACVGCTLLDHDTTADGAALRVAGTVTLTDSEVRGNQTVGNGAVLTDATGALTIEGTRFCENDVAGAVLEVVDGLTAVTGSVFIESDRRVADMGSATLFHNNTVLTTISSGGGVLDAVTASVEAAANVALREPSGVPPNLLLPGFVNSTSDANLCVSIVCPSTDTGTLNPNAGLDPSALIVDSSNRCDAFDPTPVDGGLASIPDGYGAVDPATADQDADMDGVPSHLDCNDGESDVFPAAVEICNGIDDDCDGRIDEGLPELVWLDGDGDGFGAGEPGIACYSEGDARWYERTGLAGGATDVFATSFGDCDDNNGLAYPGADEVLCNGVDEDCNNIDDGCVHTGGTGDTGVPADTDTDTDMDVDTDTDTDTDTDVGTDTDVDTDTVVAEPFGYRLCGCSQGHDAPNFSSLLARRR